MAEYPLLVSRLRWGWEVPALLNWLVNAHDLNGDERGVQSLRRTLYRLQVEMRGDTDAHLSALRELVALSRLIRDQTRRKETEMEIERLLGHLLPGTGSEIRIIGELLKIHAALKRDLGLPPSIRTAGEAAQFLGLNAEAL